MKLIRLSLLLFFITACDSGVLWKDSPYEVYWVDTTDNQSLGYSLGDGGIIQRVDKVIAIGSNEKYIVAKQRSINQQKILYYYLEKAKDKKFYDASDVVKGPFSIEQFKREKQYLGLPDFTHTF